jgi:hypothetical protein
MSEHYFHSNALVDSIEMGKERMAFARRSGFCLCFLHCHCHSYTTLMAFCQAPHSFDVEKYSSAHSKASYTTITCACNFV